MNCTPTNTDIRTALENFKAYHSIGSNTTVQDSIDFLEQDNRNFIKDDGNYKFETTELKTTVTKEVDRKRPIRPSVKGEGSKEVGSYLHDVLNDFVEDILIEIKGKSVENTLNILKTLEHKGVKKTGKDLDEVSILNLFNIAKDQIVQIYKAQQIINNQTKQSSIPVIKTRQIVIDPVKSKGGTIDLLGILSDHTFIIRDFKTSVVRPDQINADGTMRTENLFNFKQLDRHKLQITDYASILRKYYGFKGVYSNRIVPIKVYSKFNGKTFLNKLEFIAGPNQDPNLDEIVMFDEKTGFKGLDDFLAQIEDKIQKIKSNKDISSQSINQERISKLQKIKHEVISKKSFNSILEHIQYLNTISIQDLTLGELNEIIAEYQLLSNLNDSVKGYLDYLKTFDENTEQIEAKINQIHYHIGLRLEEVLAERTQNRINHIVSEAIGQQIVDKAGNPIPFEPEGFFATWFYQLSQSNNPFFQTLRYKLDQANFNKKQKVDIITQEVIEKENAVIAVLKQRGMEWSDFVELIINPKTDNFIPKVDASFLKRMESLNKDIIYEYYDIKDWYDWKEQQKQHQKQLEIKYTIDGQLDVQKVVDAMDFWDKYNNLSLDSEGKPKYPTAWLLAKQSNRLVLKDSKIEYSEQYKRLAQTPEFLAYYQMFEKYNAHFRDILKVDYRELPNNFLANIRKDTSERIDTLGIIGGAKSSLNDFIENFSIREDDRDSEDSYLKRTSIPKFFLNPFRDKDGNLKQGEKSYQFGRSLLIFAKMAYNYQEMSLIEPEIIALREVLVEKGEQYIKNKKGITTNYLGNNKVLPIKQTDIPLIFDKFVQMYLYGVHVEPVIGDKSGKWEKALLEMKNYFSLKTLGLNFVAATGSYLAASIQSTIAGKSGIFYDSNQYQKALYNSGKDRETFLALSAFFDPMGHRYGNIRLEEGKLGETQLGDMSKRGFINQYVSSRLLMQVYALGDQHIEEVITYAMAQNYYVDTDGVLRRIKFPEQKEQYKDRLLVNLFSYNNGIAKLNLPEQQQKNVIIAFRRAVQVAQSSIKGTIPEEDKAAWQSQITGQLLMNFKSWMPATINERFGKVKFDKRIDSVYMGRYTALLQDIGNMEINSKNEVLQLGAFIKSIVLPKMFNLLKHVMSFHTVGGYFKGYKMKDESTIKLMYESWLDQNPQYRGQVSFEEFLDIQQKQLKALIVELRIILAFTALSIIALGDWDDDGEKDFKKYFLTRKLVSVLFKTKQEVTFMFNPIEFANLTKNPLPMIGLLTDAIKTVNNTADELFDILINHNITLGKNIELLGEQTEVDNKNILSYTHTWIPGMQGLVRFFDVLSEDVQYLNTNK